MGPLSQTLLMFQGRVALVDLGGAAPPNVSVCGVASGGFLGAAPGVRYS